MVKLHLSILTLAAAFAVFGGALHASPFRAIQEDAPFTVFEGLALFMLTVVGGIGYISGALIGGILYGTLFLVTADFWDKLATDWASFSWFFTLLHDFFIFLGPAVAGIGLGRNPNGVASQIFNGYRPLKEKSNRGLVVGAITLVISFWLFRVTQVFDGWVFLLLSTPVILLCPLIADAKTKDKKSRSNNTMELIGIDTEFTDDIVKELDQKLSLPNSVSKNHKRGI